MSFIFCGQLGIGFCIGKGSLCKLWSIKGFATDRLSLACSLTLRSRWIPSEVNVSDGPSRGQILPGPHIKEGTGINDGSRAIKSGDWIQGESHEGHDEPIEGGSASEINEATQREEDGGFSNTEQACFQASAVPTPGLEVHSEDESHRSGRSWEACHFQP